MSAAAAAGEGMADYYGRSLPRDVIELQYGFNQTMNDFLDVLVFTYGIQGMSDAFDWYEWTEANPVRRPRWKERPEIWI